MIFPPISLLANSYKSNLVMILHKKGKNFHVIVYNDKPIQVFQYSSLHLKEVKTKYKKSLHYS